MKFAVYQIKFEDLKTALGDEGWGSKHPLVHIYGTLSALGSDAYSHEMFQYFSHVMNVEADDLEHAFMISNGALGPDEFTKRVESLDKHTSLSVGNIVIDPDGNKYMADIIGFSKIA